MSEAPSRHTLRKPERLGEKKILDELFMHGKSIQVSGIKLLWKLETNHQIIQPSNYQIKVAFSVPKKLFKKAVTRNLLKRRMREAYRKNKNRIMNNEVQHSTFKGICYLVFIYTGRKISPYSEIESKIVVTLQRLKKVCFVE